MLRHPLTPNESRPKFYYAISLTLSTVLILLRTDQYNDWCTLGLRIIVWGVFDSIILMVPVSIGYAYLKLSKPGLSRQVRSLILSRHLFTMLFFVIANAYLLMSWTVCLLPRWHNLQTNEVKIDDQPTMIRWLVYTGEFFFKSQGIFLSLLRFSEPLFFKILTQKMANCCSRKKSTDLEDDFTEKEMTPLFLFLASSLNVELVYIILKGITQFQYIYMDATG